MSLIRTAIAALGLALVLTWLLFRSLEPTDTEYMAVQQALVRISVGETRLQSDVLGARSGLLHDHDPFVADVAELHHGLAALHHVSSGAGSEPIGRIARALEAQERAADEIKSASALVENSLAQISQLSQRLARTQSAAELAARNGALTAALLLLYRDVNSDTAAEALRMVDDLARQPVPPELEADAASIVQHGRLLVELLPKVDSIVRDFQAHLTLRFRDEVRAAFAVRRQDYLARSDRYRVALYGVAILFLLSLVELGRRLRLKARALSERGRLERSLAEVSNIFVVCPPEEIRDRIVDALARFGTAARSSRAYLLFVKEDSETLMWTRPGVSTPANWPEALRQVVPVLAEVGDVFSTCKYGDVPPPSVLACLAQHEAALWSCVTILDGDELIGLLAFERAADSPPWLSDMAELIRLAGNTMSNALQRERHFRRWLAIQERVERANRMETVGLFASGIAHNFNNLLGLMLGHAEVASEHTGLPAEAARHMRQITATGERARSLVTNILDYGRRNSSACCSILIGTLAHNTADLLRPSLKHRLEVERDIGAGDIAVWGDYTQLQQVLVNLIRNAAQASEPDRPILVIVDSIRLRRRQSVSHGVLAPGLFSRLRVVDQGSGISDDVKTMLFKPFFTTRPAGTGLGLATAAEVVQDLGGAFHVESAPGQGTTFEVWLPGLDANGLNQDVALTGQGRAIMVAGTRPADMSRIEDMLAALSYEPIGCLSATTALDTFRADPERFAAVLIAADLSERSSLDLARSIRAARGRIPILGLKFGLSGPRPCDHDAALFDAVLKAPLVPVDLAAALTRLLQQRPME